MDASALQAELPQFEEHYARFGDRLPAELAGHLDALRQQLAD